MNSNSLGLKCSGCGSSNCTPKIGVLDILGRGIPFVCHDCGARSEILGRTLLENYSPNAPRQTRLFTHFPTPALS